MVQPLSAGEQPVRHALALREASAESQLVAGIYRQLAPALRCGREVGSGGEPAGRSLRHPVFHIGALLSVRRRAYV